MNKEVVSKRDDIIRKNNFQLLKIFDTNEHEDYKDVVLVYDPVDKRKKVLRVGEHRAKNFLYKGYNGKKLVIPKIYKINTVKNNQYEIEEFIHGKLIYECFGPPLATRIMPDKYMNLMIEAFWEFQRLAQKVKLPKYEIWHKKFLKHYGHAVKLINDKSRIATILKTKKIKDFFEDNNYVCKWKFSVDNLLITPDNKLGFIDLANVGKRFWGYDLGWIFWPGWFQLPITQYKKSAEHFSYLEKLFRKVEKKSKIVEKWGFWGLVFFVAIPFPATGAWTGAVAANLFEMKIRKATLAILIGVAIAGIIVSLVVSGVIQLYFAAK